MSLTPRLTLIGLYKHNPAVFSNLNLPAAVDEETFIDSLMLEYGECPLIYPDYDFMVLAIGAWCRKWYHNIERIAAAITQEYNPLHNYDRTETWTENEEGSKDFTRGIVDGESATEQQTIAENETINQSKNIDENETVNRTENENITDENLVSAYNEDDYQPSTKNVIDRETETETETEKTTDESGTTTDTKNTTSNKTNRNDKSTDETYNENNGRQNTKSGRAYGNIGVTESTTMLQHEIDIRRTENLYHIISELFYKEFCIYVF